MSDPLSRGDFFQITAAAGAAAAGPGSVAAAAGPVAPLKMRWYGGGVYELATPDDKAIVLVDAWIWNNTGFKAFALDKPAELSSAAAYAAHVKGRAPAAVVVALTHNPLVVGPQCGDLFRAAVARVSPQTAVTLLRPGETTTLRIATAAR